MIGQTLGHYRVLEQIGAGGMGVVYRAHDERLDRDVALKVLPAGTLADESARKRFRKEALTLSKLNHPNIETVFDFDTQDGVDFLVMELISGVTLDQKLVAGPLPEKEVLHLGQQLAEGLTAAHAEGVVHRDLKPGNLRLSRDGRLKILDFGLAKLLQPVSDVAATASVTETHAVTGTLPYMAPEQLRGEPADARSDIWTAGAVLYELGTGRRPFGAKLSTELAGDIQHKPPPSPRQLRPELSSKLEDITLKCLEKDPDNRYQSARELAVDLRRLAAPPSTVMTAAAPPARKSWRLAAAASLGLLVALIAAVTMLKPGWRDRLWGGTSSPEIRSIAVLPLKNLSGDPQQEYFADGMTETLTAELSKISALKVISRTSAMQYKAANKAAPEIARELDVDALIEGSVLRESDQVRITVQLIHGPTDKHLWADSYQREVHGILALQSAMARGIAERIRVELTPQEKAQMARARQVHPQAQEYYLRGRYEWNKRTAQGLEDALAYFQRAVEADPTYAAAYVGVADTYLLRASYGLASPQDELPKARVLAEKALALDAGLPEAHASLGSLLADYYWDWGQAEQHLRRAVDLDPNHATGHQWYAELLMDLGRFDEALFEAQRARALNPLAPAVHLVVGKILYYARRYDEAIEHLQGAVKLYPNFGVLYIYLGLAHLQKGMTAEAEDTFRQGQNARGAFLALAGLEAYVKVVTGREAEARQIIKKMEARRRQGDARSFDFVVPYLGLGDREKALANLERAYEERNTQLRFVKVEPILDPLRSDPRFQDLLRRMNFPP